MNIWHDINPDRITPDKFVVCIEIQSNSKNKYELDKETGLLRLDRILFTSTHYPANYGFIPLTYAEDDDPLDVLLICSEPINPLTLVECVPIGVIKMNDQGSNDEKIVAVCPHDPVYAGFKSIYDLPQHVMMEFKNFFEIYKTLEDKETTVTEIDDEYEARDLIKECIERYKEKFKK